VIFDDEKEILLKLTEIYQANDYYEIIKNDNLKYFKLNNNNILLLTHYQLIYKEKIFCDIEFLTNDNKTLKSNKFVLFQKNEFFNILLNGKNLFNLTKKVNLKVIIMLIVIYNVWSCWFIISITHPI
jgi:hypothetical protein